MLIIFAHTLVHLDIIFLYRLIEKKNEVCKLEKFKSDTKTVFYEINCRFQTQRLVVSEAFISNIYAINQVCSFCQFQGFCKAFEPKLFAMCD